MGFNGHESSAKFCIKWEVGVIANEGAEGCIRCSGATTVESIAKQAGPANSLTCPCKPLVGSAAT